MELPAEIERALASLPFPVPVVLLLAAFIFAVIIAFILKLVFRRKSNTILLVGPPGAGKTALFYKLKNGKDVNTIMSMKENEGTFAFHSERGSGASRIHLIDVPGHQRVRGRANEYLNEAKAIIFVVDAVAFRARDAAEHLYQLLSNKQVRQLRLPILICLNKSELHNAQAPEAVRADLEREIQAVRQTLKAQPRDAHSETVKVGIEGKEFKFDHVPNKFAWSTCSARDGKTQALETFVRRLIR